MCALTPVELEQGQTRRRQQRHQRDASDGIGRSVHSNGIRLTERARVSSLAAERPAPPGSNPVVRSCTALEFACPRCAAAGSPRIGFRVRAHDRGSAARGQFDFGAVRNVPIGGRWDERPPGPPDSSSQVSSSQISNHPPSVGDCSSSFWRERRPVPARRRSSAARAASLRRRLALRRPARRPP